MAREAPETPEVTETDTKGKSRWTEFLTPISIGIAAIGLLINFVMQFQSQIKEDVKRQTDQEKVLVDRQIEYLQGTLKELRSSLNTNEATTLRLRADFDEQSARLKSLERIAKYLPQAGLSFAAISVVASAKNCQAVVIRPTNEPGYTSRFTSICTIPKRLLQAIPDDAKIIASVLANSHYNLRLTENQMVGSLDISEIAEAQPPNDRGSEGHAETIITLNDLTRQGGTFFLSRPYVPGEWSPLTDRGFVWIGTVIIYFQAP